MSDFERKIQEEINRLPKCIEPEKELWTGIEIALHASQKKDNSEDNKRSESPRKIIPKNSVFALAASITFIAFLGWFGTQQGYFIESDYPSQLVASLEKQHIQHKEALLVSFEGGTPLTQNWQEQLTELDEAAVAIKSALKEDPDNVTLLKMLQQIYQQQISLIEKVYAPKWQKI